MIYKLQQYKMRHIMSLVTAFLLFTNSFAQSKIVIDEVITANDGVTKEYMITKSLTLKPSVGQTITFSATPTTTYTFRLVNPESQHFPASLDQNFVRTETILSNGLTDENAIRGLPFTNKATSYDYFDAAGRSIQSVSVMSSPTLNDGIMPYVYDPADGWMTESRLPYTATSNKGVFRPSAVSEQSTFYSATPKVPTDDRPYTTTEFEKSPLARVSTAYGPGSLWKDTTTAKGAKGLQKVNAANTIRKWVVDVNNLPVSIAYYLPGILIGFKSIDEDGNESEQYTDIRGNVVCSMSNGLSTYYIYDELGRLRYVLPPELCNDYPPAVATANPTQALLDTWAFQYKYDNHSRVTEEKSPGPNNDWVYYVYDGWDRVTLSQDGLQRSKSLDEWSFVKYDELNRPIISGILKSSNTVAVMRGLVAGARFEIKNTSSEGYTLTNSFPHTGISGITSLELNTITYYDDYTFKALSGWDAEAYNYDASSGFDYLPAVKGLATGAKVKILGENKWLNSVNYYDKRYRLVQSVEEHHLSGTDRITDTYNFSGWLTQSKRIHTALSTTTTVVEDYEYDHRGRLLKLFHTINAQPKTLLVAYGYNEIGQVVEANLHSVNNSPFLQSVDYRYNIRGWLTSINNADIGNDGVKNDDTNDLFGMELSYNQEQHTIASAANPTTLLYNGRISAARWKTDNQKDVPKARIYGYAYDAKSRLTSANFAATNGTTWSDEAGQYNLSNLAYDDNGNVNTLKRYAASENSALLIDDLSYGYAANGNELTTVEDASSAYGYKNGTQGLSTEMTYDKNGNLTSDLNSFTFATYNHLNLPAQIIIDRASPAADITIDFRYDATGYALSKTVKDGNTVIQQIDYVKGIHYYGNSQAIIFTATGRATNYKNTYEYEYFLKDHVSNTRLIFSSGHKTDVFKATMETQFAAQEQADFKNIAETRYIPLYNHTPASLNVPNPTASAQLFGGGDFPTPVGPAKMLQVKAGEQVQMEAFAYYVTGTAGNSALVTNLAGFVASGFGAISVGETATAFTGINNTVPGFAGGITASTMDTPKAYLAYILFNTTYTTSQTGFFSVPLAALGNWQKLMLNQVMPYDGYLYVYVANESTATPCYFDDVKITHHRLETGLQVVEATDYDPFGYVLAGTHYINEGKTVNNYLYQGDYAEYDKYSQWTRFEGRGNYDARLGRWHSADPRSADFTGYTPYIGMGNNPISIIDPDGRFWQFVAAAVIGGAANVWSNWDKVSQNPWSGVSYFAVGATAGVATVLNPFNVVGNAGILSIGNQAANVLNGFPLNPTQAVSDFTFSWMGWRAGQDAFKLGANQIDNLSYNQLTSLINKGGGGSWTYLNRIIKTSADDVATSKELLKLKGQSGNVIDFTVEVGAKLNGNAAGVAKAIATNGGVNSVDDLLAAGTKMNKIGGATQLSVKGNADEIFNSLSEGGELIRPNQVKLTNGTIITKYPSSTTGVSTLQLNIAGKLYKVRIK